MVSDKYFATTNLWIECVKFYNRGYSFEELTKIVRENFPDFGYPSGASTSLVIDLYGYYSKNECEDIAYEILSYLDYRCPRKSL